MVKVKKKKSGRRLIWAFILIGYGFYTFVSGIGYKDLSEFAMGTLMGQGSIFVIWGLKEWVEYSLNQKKKLKEEKSDE